jgi:hypothetical protein
LNRLANAPQISTPGILAEMFDKSAEPQMFNMKGTSLTKPVPFSLQALLTLLSGRQPMDSTLESPTPIQFLGIS